MNIVKIKWNISFSACFIEKTTVVFELLKNVWINSSWDDLYSNLSKTSSKINIFTVKSPLWDLQVSRSQRSEEVFLFSPPGLNRSIRNFSSSVNHLPSVEWNNKPVATKRPVYVQVIYVNCWFMVLEEKLQDDICWISVEHFCFATIIDVGMY